MKTITLPTGTEAVRYDELAHLIALAMWPLKNDGSPGDGLNYGFASVTLERELAQAVEAKDIPLKDPLTLGPYIDHPGGTRLEDALVRVDDLRKYVADRGFVVVVNESDTPAQALEHVPGVDLHSMANLPPVVVGTWPAPLTTGDIAHCFAGLRWSESEWKKPLGDKPKWLAECVVIPGQQGVSETRWNPVSIGAALVHNGHVLARSVRSRFQTLDMLKPWFDAWKTYEADNVDSE
jgi:hypothetical protein